jgi:hypothetical protein
MSTDPDEFGKQIDALLNLPEQAWLLGAGVSNEAGIPLMQPLTERVQTMLTGDQESDFRTIRGDLDPTAHVEHVLSHVGDLISLAARAKHHTVVVGRATRDIAFLRALHARIQECIRDTIRFGYKSADGGRPEEVGTRVNPIVSIDPHTRFVRALFGKRRAGLERRPPVPFFTLNYDTLVEDALALSRVRATDGFSGGAMAFWDPDEAHAGLDDPFSEGGGYQARVFKLHGSIDWFMSSEDAVVRLREGAGYPPDAPGRLLIYPQATKYEATQRDPFARLFAAFRAALASDRQALLAVCGYSFGDEHVNEEIERALRRRGNQLTLVASELR